MKELYRVRSQNGSRGLAVVGPAGTTFPCQGSVRRIGLAGGIVTYQFYPSDDFSWLMIGEDAVVHGGASVVHTIDLQGGNFATLLLLGKQAVIEHYGYKRRTSKIIAYREGEELDIPGSVLMAMGLVVSEGGSDTVEQPPPPLEGAMAAAFKRAFE